jgi:hypothetical protein
LGKLRARFMLLLALGAAGGCEISGSCSKVAEIPSFDNVQAKADVDWISIMSNYKAVINGPSPIQIDVALYSHDAKESQVQDPSCAANTGIQFVQGIIHSIFEVKIIPLLEISQLILSGIVCWNLTTRER